jgi:hypothetical protein
VRYTPRRLQDCMQHKSIARHDNNEHGLGIAPGQKGWKVQESHERKRLTRHKISDREPTATCHAAKVWMANTQKVDRTLARGSLHRLVRCYGGVCGTWSPSAPCAIRKSTASGC